MGSNPLVSGVMLIAFMALFYFLMIKPQSDAAKKRQKMLASLKPGDKVVTAGGIYGDITEVKEKSIKVKIAKDVIVRMDRAGVNQVTSKDED